MVYVLIRHRVSDYDKWRGGFNQEQGLRTNAEGKSFRVFRDHYSSDHVTVLNEWETIEKAEKFLDFEEIKEKMKELGVKEKPDIIYMDEN